MYIFNNAGYLSLHLIILRDFSTLAEHLAFSYFYVFAPGVSPFFSITTHYTYYSDYLTSALNPNLIKIRC